MYDVWLWQQRWQLADSGRWCGADVGNTIAAHGAFWSRMTTQKKCETVASLTYPSYTVTAVGGRHVVVGGGGGSAKTGIKNQFVSLLVVHFTLINVCTSVILSESCLLFHESMCVYEEIDNSKENEPRGMCGVTPSNVCTSVIFSESSLLFY